MSFNGRDQGSYANDSESGLLLLNVDKPIILYSVARFRMTTNSSDRIDAIM